MPRLTTEIYWFLSPLQPVLLDLYDTYYLPMQIGLRPVMKSFILALLPGLEEETGEFFDKVKIPLVSQCHLLMFADRC
jgi:hypothetical protein